MTRWLLALVMFLVPVTAFAQTACPPQTTEDKRKICVAALNEDKEFAGSIVKTINEDTYLQHAKAADSIAKNERHVILAYAAMWLLAAGFVLFLWRRQQRLVAEISQLRRDLDAATKS